MDEGRKRLILYAAGLGGLVALAIALIVILTSGSGSSGGVPSKNSIASKMEAAGCTYKQYQVPPPRGDMHVTKLTAKPLWVTNPPSGGQHYFSPAPFNFYDDAVNPLLATHNLEHGGVIIWYGPKVSAETKSKLRAFYNESPVGLLVTPYAGLGSKIALSAWTANDNAYQAKKQVGYFGDGHFSVCKTFDEDAFKAFRDFRGHGPESQFTLQDLQPNS